MLYRSGSFVIANYESMKGGTITSLLRNIDGCEEYEDVVNDVVIDMYDVDVRTIKKLVDLIEIKEKQISKQDALKYYIKYCNSTKTKEKDRELG